MQRDEPAAALVAAMRRPADDSDRVAMADFHDALEHGAPDDASPALRAFFDFAVGEPPAWVDPDLCKPGARSTGASGATPSTSCCSSA